MHSRNAPQGRLATLARLVPLGALLAMPLAVGGLPGSTQSAEAAPGDRTTAQWNMRGQYQGEGSPPESRWQSRIPEWMRHTDVLALQEAGSAPPERAVWNERRFVGAGVTEHTLNLGGSERPDLLNIYWADAGQQRNGLAIVTRETATDVVQLPVHNGNSDDSRPIMGIQLGDDWYFNGHGRSGGESNADDMYEAARQEMRRRGVPDANWHMNADFNTLPSDMPANMQNRIVAVHQPTHQGGNELDFAMEGAPTNESQRAERHWVNSDHHGLLFDHQGCLKRDLRCQAPLPGHTYRFFSKHKSGSVISRIRDGEPALLPYRHGRDKSNPYYTVQVRFSSDPGEYLLAYGESSDTCIERNGNDTVATRCDPDDEAQHWKLDGDRQIQDPDRTGYLQPGANGLIVRGYRYDWEHKGLDYVPPHDELKRDEAEHEQQDKDDRDKREQAEQGKDGKERDAGRAGSDAADAGRAGSDAADSGRAGSDAADSDRTGASTRERANKSSGDAGETRQDVSG